MTDKKSSKESLYFGMHVGKGPKDKNMETALERAVDELGINCCQIFVSNPRSYALVKMDYKKVAEVIKKLGIVVPVHSNYPTIGVWNTSKGDDDFLRKTHNIRAQMDACKQLGAYGFVIHLPRMSAKKVVEKIKEVKIAKYAELNDVPVFLENMPVKNAESGKAFLKADQINELVSELKKAGYPASRIGICIDTAHLWGGGVDLSTKASMVKWLSEINHPEYIRLIHMNGAREKTFNSGQDKHAPHFAKTDEMFGSVEPKKSGIAALIEFAISKKIPIVCEFKENDKDSDKIASLKFISDSCC